MNDDAEHPDLHSRQYPVREDMAYQLNVWRFERCGWYLLVILVVLGLLGLFSRGLLSTRDIRSEDGRVRVQYEMFHRNGSTNPMKISVSGGPESTVELELTGEIMEGFSIETLQPEPVRARSSAQGIRFWVQTDTQGQAALFITLRGDGLGVFHSRIVLPGSNDVKLAQFIFP